MSRKSYSLDFKLKVIEEAENSKIPKKDMCEVQHCSIDSLDLFEEQREDPGQ